MALGTGLDWPRRAVVLMTEVRSQDQVACLARFARARELLLQGVGSEAVRAELEEVTGSPERVMIYAGPQDLFGQILKLRGKRCSQQCPGKDQACTVPAAGQPRPTRGPAGQWQALPPFGSNLTRACTGGRKHSPTLLYASLVMSNFSLYWSVKLD